MAINQSALSCVPSSVTAGNAESSANLMVSTWKGLCDSWNQETADAVGTATVNHAVQWYNMVMAALDAKIEKFQAEYEAQKSKYDSEKSMYSSAKRELDRASEDKDNCMEYERIQQGPGFSSVSTAQNVGAKKTVIADIYGYEAAVKRENSAKAEMSRHDAQMKNFQKQMKAAESKVREAEKEKEKEGKKLEDFINSVYELNLMNESVIFLTAVKNSGMKLSKATEKKLYGRLFFIGNKFRKQFDKFEEIIKNAGEKYSSSDFSVTPSNIDYSAERNVKGKKFKGKVKISLISESNTSAVLSCSGKNDFIFPKSKLNGAEEKVKVAFKNYELKVDRSNFTAELNKVYENESIESEVEQLGVRSDEYAGELATILDAMQENGASTSKLFILVGKISNWHRAHWPKIWYKILFLLTCAIVVAGIAFGAIATINTIQENKRYKDSFVSWTVSKNSETKRIRNASKRFVLSATEMRYIQLKEKSAEDIQKDITTHTDRAKNKPDQFLVLDEENQKMIEDELKGMLSTASEISVEIKISDYSGKISKRSGKRSLTSKLTGYIKLSVSQDGSVTISDLTGVGFRKTNH